MLNPFVAFEMRDWDWVAPWQEDLAQVSPAYFALLKQLNEHSEALPPYPLDDLHAIWEAAGSPEGKDPETYLVDPTSHSEAPQIERREGRVWADYETAAWYTHHLDPEHVEPGHIVEMLY